MQTAALIHEIAQPLASIAANAETLTVWLSRRGAVEEEVAESVAEILSEVERVGRLIHAVRGWFKGTANSRVRVDLAAVLRRVLARATAPALDGRTSLSARVDDALWVDADPVLIEHALRNLVSNAMDAARRSRTADRTVDVEARRDGPWVVVTVSDSGPGFAVDALARATEPFFTMKGDDGLCVGLTIVRWLAETHGGHVAVSNDGRGARVELSLALAAD
jgi:C4-dicarboxylate-specific signal transduction histidine kinase